MKTQINPSIKAHLLWSALILLALLAVCAIPFALAQWSDGRTTSATPSRQTRRTLTFVDRVGYQRAIEAVYWRHRIWSKEQPGPKPPLEKIMSQAQIEQKVEEYLRNSELLDQYWHRPITPEQLQTEMDRMARHSKQPEVLHEIFQALGNDPFVVAECLARPALAERLITQLYGADQRIHEPIKRRAESELTGGSVQRMQQMSGNYNVVEWIRSGDESSSESMVAHASRLPAEASAGGAPALQQQAAPDDIKMTSSQWQENLDKLATGFEQPGENPAQSKSAASPDRDVWARIKPGVLSKLQETVDGYYTTAVLRKSRDKIKLATVMWRKQPIADWRAQQLESTAIEPLPATAAEYSLPEIAPAVADQCSENTWTATSPTFVSFGRLNHTAVWTGSEMIIWGGANVSYLNTGGRYNPSTDTWTATSTTNPPVERAYHTAVWTGSEMIVWGGSNSSSYLNTGGRYNPSTDSWTVTSTTHAPVERAYHTAVWTGSEMIVWGGYDGSFLNTGGRYNPSTNTWTPTSTTNAPVARYDHTAVWTGSEMIVWGGVANGSYFNTGGRYNPSTDTWTATSTTFVPVGRSNHTAVWTGSEMIVWGGANTGGYLNTGARYNLSTGIWTATSATNALEARYLHTAVWTGSEMIVWGGNDGSSYLNTGGRYNPTTDTWTATSTTFVPGRRYAHTAVWTGSEMIVWGGENTSGVLNTGGRYNPSTNSWTATNITAPEARWLHTAVWTGSEMIVWGGENTSGVLNTGGRYNPSTDTWTATSTFNAPDARWYHTAVWTGSEMIVWGGFDSSVDLNTGGRYNPSTNAWTATSTINAPFARAYHTAVWTGSEMIVWGGLNSSGYLNTGGRYNPTTNTWTATSTTNALVARYYHTAVWTGSEMIVWGGNDGSSFLNTGRRYNPSTDSWTDTSNSNAPIARYQHTAVWSGSEMIVWGGSNGSYLNTGGRYNPSTNAWTATSTINAPVARAYHTAVWTGSEMIVWGGFNTSGYLNTGGRYNPSTNTWTATSTTNGPVARWLHTAVWTGSEMIVWGGLGGGYLDTGGRYCAEAPPPPTPTPTPSATPPSPPTAHPATLVTSSSFTANWSSVSGATGYRLDAATNTSFTTYVTGYQNLNVGNVTSRSVTGLNASTTYYYRVRAYNGNGTSGNSNTISLTTLTATGPPVVTTNPSTSVASFSATLNGSLDPHGLTTSVYFQYGTTTSYGSNTASHSFSGSTYRNVIANVRGLSASTTYHFRIVATNSAGTRYGSDRTFTTLSATGSPVVITNAATLIASFSARLNGSVDPHGLTTSVYFQYGTTTSYGSTTASQTKSGNTYQSVSANISGLSPSTTYHFRLVATNSAGTRYGSDRTFTTLTATGPPVVTTNPATLIASFSTTLNGSVDPHGLTTSVHFQYGTTTGYGSTTPSQSQTGNTYRNIAANISGLSASTTYHFRIVAINSAGTRYGADRTFTALSATGPPVVTTNPATNVTSASATLNGSLDPHGLTTRVDFEYGTTTSYGHTTAMQSQTGNTYRHITANISGLTTHTTYHFRIVATNIAGSRYGSDRTFTTP